MKVQIPYYTEKTTVIVGDDTVEVKAFQIIVWLSISPNKSDEWDVGIPRFPAILDVGNNHNFAISETHLAKWAGLHALALHELRRIRDKGRRIPLRSASLWIHTGDVTPLRLNVDAGIAVYEPDGPRLPTLGLRALTNNRLRALVHGDEKRAIVRTPPRWYWPL